MTSRNASLCKRKVQGGIFMSVHHGGKIGDAASKLARKNTSKKTKSKAGKKLWIHKEKYHK